MNKLFYPAIFHVAEESGFWITFPDLPECMTQGDNMQEAYEMAVDALGLALTSREQENQEIQIVQPNSSYFLLHYKSPENTLFSGL